MAVVDLDPWNIVRKEGYSLKHTLGTGPFSKVREAYSLRFGKMVAIKCISCKNAPPTWQKKFVLWQVKKLPYLQHENIVQVFEIFENKIGLLFIVMEAAVNLDMLHYIQWKRYLKESEIKRFISQLCQAVIYLHSHSIYHGNLKCENLLLDKNLRLLVTDCGFSPVTETTRNNCHGNLKTVNSMYFGNVEYAAPEVLKGYDYNPRLQDLWSIGVITYMMACGCCPFNAKNLRLMLKLQIRGPIAYPRKIEKELSTRLKSFITYQLQPHPSKRPSIDHILSHPFLDNFFARKNEFQNSQCADLAFVVHSQTLNTEVFKLQE